MDSKNKCVIIGISGVTCGGKSTLASKLNKYLKNSVIIQQDKYFYPDDSPKHVKVPGLDHHNHDILGSLDMNRMYGDILDLVSRDEVKIVIVEGFIVLNYKPILDLCHLKYQFFLSREVCERRRNQRVYTRPEYPGYFEKCVWPEYCKHMKELEAAVNIKYLNGEDDKLFEIVMADISSLLE